MVTDFYVNYFDKLKLFCSLLSDAWGQYEFLHKTTFWILSRMVKMPLSTDSIYPAFLRGAVAYSSYYSYYAISDSVLWFILVLSFLYSKARVFFAFRDKNCIHILIWHSLALLESCFMNYVFHSTDALK